MPALEIAVTSAAGAVIARANGADRVELCSALELGGITPSQGLIEAAVDVGLPVHVLIRPRPGDFVFDADEVVLMERETRAAVRSGAAGVVIGALTSEARIDRTIVDRLADVARTERGEVQITVHRAIDLSVDPTAALAELADPDDGTGAHARIDRVLTSGGAARAGLGAATIKRMVALKTGVEVMAGGGVAVGDVILLCGLGAAAVHLSAKSPVAQSSRAAGSRIPLGTADTEAASRFVTDPLIVAEARAALDEWRALELSRRS